MPLPDTEPSLLIISQGIDGGIAPLASQLAYGMRRQGWVCALRYVGRPAESGFVPIDRQRGVESDAIVTGTARSAGEAWGLIRSIIPVIKAARKNKPTVVIFAGFIPALLYPVFLLPFTSARFVFWDHAPQNTFAAVKKLVFPLALSRIDRIVSISPSTASAMTEYFGVSPDKITIITNGVDPLRWHNLPPAPDFSVLRVIMPARIDLNQKDPVTLVKAAARLHEQGTRITVTFVGSGAGEDRVRAAIAAENAADFIRLIPHSDDVPSLVAQSNVLCLSTKFEGLPTVVIEGMLAKRAIVASRVAGCVDLIRDGETGFLFEPSSVDDCAAKIQALQTAPSLQRVIQEAYREAISRYTLQSMCDNFLGVLKS